MKFELVVSFLSTFQIYHQSASATMASLDFGLTSNELSIVSAAFPAGKFIGTLVAAPLYRRSSNRRCLDANAFLLTIGAMLMLLPSCSLLCIGRVVAGIGVGIGFVSSTIALKDCAPFERRQQTFLNAALLFSGAALYAAALTLLKGITYFHFMLILVLPSFIAVGVYYLNRDMYDEPEKDLDDLDDDLMECAVFNPRFLAFVLMTLNAAIGVPFILCFSSYIFTHVGINPDRAATLSILYPILQILLLGFAHRCGGDRLSRRQTIIGGYGICLALYFALIVTEGFGTLEKSPHFHASSTALWIISLAVATVLPCNAAVCVISESFKTRNSLFRGTSHSRAFFWFLSALSCGTFVPMMESGSLFTALLPGFCLSVLSFVYVFIILPEDLDLSATSLHMYGTMAENVLY